MNCFSPGLSNRSSNVLFMCANLDNATTRRRQLAGAPLENPNFRPERCRGSRRNSAGQRRCTTPFYVFILFIKKMFWTWFGLK